MSSQLAPSIDLSGLRPEGHVEEAFETARALSDDQPIQARTALLAAVVVARDGSSKAFRHLAKLLEHVDVPDVDLPPVKKRADRRSALEVSPGMAEAFARAAPFLEDGRVWGRDYVTLALTATDDPSLERLAKEAEVPLDRLRERWLKFVTTEGERREPGAWRAWLHGESDVPAPEQERIQRETRAADVPPPHRDRRPAPEPGDGPSIQTPGLDRAAYLERFDTAALDVMACAAGLAGGGPDDSVHMEHLAAAFLRAAEDTLRPVLDEAGLTLEEASAALTPAHEPPLSTSSSWPPLHELPPLSRHAFLALRMAEGRAEALGDGTIGVEDLVNGALSIRDCSVVRRLRQAGLSRSSLPDGWAWEPRIRLAGYRSDATSGTDLLDMTRDARVLATIMASERVSPPLSIGLFGEWGSGKSFFMRLLQKEIRSLERSGGPDFCQRVVQIRFNAWHYIDSNLWASLANEVFERLGREIEAHTGGDGEEAADEAEATRRRRERRTEAARLLMAARRSRSELQRATEQKREAEDELRKATAEVSELEEEHWLLTSSVSEARLATETLRLLQGDAEIRRWLRELGIDEEDLDHRALKRRLDRWRDRRRWLLGWWQAIKDATLRRKLAALLFVGVALALGRSDLPWLQGALEWLKDSVAVAVGLGAAVAPFLDRTRELLRRVRPVMEKLQKAEESARESLREEGEARRRLHEERYERARAEEQAKRAHLQEIETQLRTLLSDDPIREFVVQRRESEDYRKHLGVIARARQDFEQLSRLLRRTSPDEAQEGEFFSDADEALERELARYRDELPRIDRIVLYIDDLDRCPEEKVVDVLQAVHLLLAFKLFVVVVGVDPRWLLHSLAERSDVFADIGGNGKGGRSTPRYWRSTPMDYLEKIFQIPFHLRPMGEQGFEALVEELTREDGEEDVGEPRGDGARGARDHGTDDPDSAGEGPGPDDEVGEAPGVTARDKPADTARERGRGEQPTAAGSAERETASPTPESGNAHEPGDQADSDGKADPSDGTPPPSPRLTIAGWERRFMQALHPFIRSPRSAKRFVNVYRLVRASHVESLTGTSRGRPEPSGAYVDDAHHQVMYLLAMLTGFPGPSIALFRRIHEMPTREQSWTAFRATSLSEPPAENPGPDDVEDAWDDDVDPEEWRDFLEAIDRVHAEMEERDISFDPPMRELHRWSAKVARYSFRSGPAVRTVP